MRVTIKGAIAFLCVVLSVALPQIAHAAGGAAAGSVYMPMYAPALIAGCLLGWSWGLGVGIIAPLISCGFTLLTLGSAMPAPERLPVMVLELAAFGGISGLFSSRIQKSPLLAFPAVLSAQVGGRAVYVIYNLIAGDSASRVFSSVQTSLTGLYIQLILIPAIVIALCLILKRHEK